MIDDGFIQQLLKRYDDAPGGFQHTLIIQEWDGKRTMSMDGVEQTDDQLDGAAKSHFGRQASKLTRETKIAFFVLHLVVPARLAERYMVRFRDFLFPPSTVPMALAVGTRWIEAWLTLACYDQELRPFVRWNVNAPENPEG